MRYSSDKDCASGQMDHSADKNASRSSENALHSNNVWWIVSETPASQQGHVALRTRSIRAALLRSGWHPTLNLVLSLRPSRSEHGHKRLRYSGSPNRVVSTQTFIFRRVFKRTVPRSNSADWRAAKIFPTNFFAAPFVRDPGHFAALARRSKYNAPFLDEPEPRPVSSTRPA